MEDKLVTLAILTYTKAQILKIDEFRKKDKQIICFIFFFA